MPNAIGSGHTFCTTMSAIVHRWPLVAYPDNSAICTEVKSYAGEPGQSCDGGLDRLAFAALWGKIGGHGRPASAALIMTSASRHASRALFAASNSYAPLAVSDGAFVERKTVRPICSKLIFGLLLLRSKQQDAWPMLPNHTERLCGASPSPPRPSR